MSRANASIALLAAVKRLFLVLFKPAYVSFEIPFLKGLKPYDVIMTLQEGGRTPKDESHPGD